MSTPAYNDDDPDYDQEPEQRTRTVPRDVWKQMEQKAKTATEAEQRAQAAERKLAFAEAGLPLTDPKMQYFMRGYEGDLTADAIREKAIADGFLNAVSSSADTEAQTAARIDSAATGAQASSTEQDRIAELHAAAAKGKDALYDQMRAHGHTVTYGN